MYTFDSRVRYSEIGEDKKLTLYSLLNYFQDCTTFHSESLGRGMEVLEPTGYAWVLASWQVCISRYPKIGENIQVCTWPYSFRGFCGERNFQLLTDKGEVLAYANSIWTFINGKTGMPAKILPEEAEAYPLEEKLDMAYAPRKIAMPGNAVTMESFTVKQHHLDTNHHVNNGQYIQMAYGYLPSGFRTRKLRAEYKMQAHLGDCIYPRISGEENAFVITLNDEKGEPYFIGEFKQ